MQISDFDSKTLDARQQSLEELKQSDISAPKIESRFVVSDIK